MKESKIERVETRKTEKYTIHRVYYKSGRVKEFINYEPEELKRFFKNNANEQKEQ